MTDTNSSSRPEVGTESEVGPPADAAGADAAGPAADPVTAEIATAVQAGRAGDRPTARARLDDIWTRIGDGGDPFHRCVLAHYAADVQDDPHEELRWDQRALAAADEVTEERARAHDPSLRIAGFYPSLHLNLADVHRRLGNDADARHHLGRARARVGQLSDDGYGQMIRSGIERCGERLEHGDRSALL